MSRSNRERYGYNWTVIEYRLKGVGALQLGLNFPQSVYLINVTLHSFRNSLEFDVYA
jgi:hypothetical protein